MNVVCVILAKKPKMGVGMEWLFGAALVKLVVGATAPIVGSIAVVTTPVTTLVIALVIIAFGVTAISRHLKLWLQETMATLISTNMGNLIIILVKHHNYT
jgi:hypothetical protein